MSWDGRERRRKKRYGVKDAVVRYRKHPPFGLLFPPSDRYLVINLSQTGIAFITRDRLEEGVRLGLTLHAPPARVPIRAGGRVVWVHKSDRQDAFRVGVRFTRMSERARNVLKAVLDNAVIDSVDISTRVYLKELERL